MTVARYLPLAPAIIGAAVCVALATGVDQPVLRLALQTAAVTAAMGMTVRAASLWAAAAAPGGAEVGGRAEATVSVVDRRVPIYDRTTGLCAGWYFRLRLDEEMARAVRYAQRFALIRIRVDASFPASELAERLRGVLRQTDFAGELDDLFIVLPNTSHAGALVLIQRMGAPMADRVIDVAEFPDGSTSVDHLLGADDWTTAHVSSTVA